MAFWTSSLETLTSTFRHGRLWLAQFFGNLLLFAGIVGFLRLDVATAWDVILNVLIGALVIVATAALHGGAMNYFLETAPGKKSALKPPFMNALKHVLPLIIWMAVFYFLRGLVDRLD